MDMLSMLAFVLSLSGNILINHKRRVGFVVWLASNVMWIAVNVKSGEPNVAQVAMFVAYIAFNIQGWLKWGKP